MDIVSFTFAKTDYDRDKPLYIDATNSSRCLSARDAKTLVRQLVAGFSAHSLEKGDCVCVISFSDIHYSSIYLGVVGAGGIFSGANPGYTTRELVDHFMLTSPKFLLTAPKSLGATITAAKKCGIPKSNIFVLNFCSEPLPEDYQPWNALLEYGESEWVHVNDPDTTVAVYASTSGTSGLPKAAILTHSYLVSQGKYQANIAAAPYDLTTLLFVPPFHAYAFPLQHTLPLRHGVPTYIMQRFDEAAFLDSVMRYRVTQTAIVPSIMLNLSRTMDVSKLSTLRRVLIAGSTSTDSMQQKLYDKLSPEARIQQVYGMTEVGWVTHWQRETRDTTGSIGQPLPGVKLRLVSSTGTPIQPTPTPSEIQILSPHPMLGYLGDPSSTTSTFTPDNWLRTGDIGYSANGNWYIVGRSKELMKVRGWQVSPAEIESVLLECPVVKDGAVVGMQMCDGSGEVPIAFVVKADMWGAVVVGNGRMDEQVNAREKGVTGEWTEEGVRKFVNERMARYKALNEVRFVQSIPKNAMGKILRGVVREWLGRGNGDADGVVRNGGVVGGVVNGVFNGP